MAPVNIANILSPFYRFKFMVTQLFNAVSVIYLKNVKYFKVSDVEILLWTIERANSHSKTLMQCFACHGLCQAYNCMPDIQLYA